MPPPSIPEQIAALTTRMDEAEAAIDEGVGASLIESFRTMYTSAAPFCIVRFADGILARMKADISRQVAGGAIVPTAAAHVLDVNLGDPADAGRSVSAFIQHGVWTARCECGGCEVVDLDEPLFMCCSCWNRVEGHRWRPIVVPDEREAIEHALLLRPMVENRNWLAGETLDALEAENVEHGVTP